MEKAVNLKSGDSSGSHIQTRVPQEMLTMELHKSLAVGTTHGQSSRWGALWNDFFVPREPSEANDVPVTTTSTSTTTVTSEKTSATPHTSTCNTSSQTADTDHSTVGRPFRYNTAWYK